MELVFRRGLLHLSPRVEALPPNVSTRASFRRTMLLDRTTVRLCITASQLVCTHERDRYGSMENFLLHGLSPDTVLDFSLLQRWEEGDFSSVGSSAELTGIFAQQLEGRAGDPIPTDHQIRLQCELTIARLPCQQQPDSIVLATSGSKLPIPKFGATI